jgi:hypothetical protein
LNKYLIITSRSVDYDDKTTCLIIKDELWYNALSKAFKYYGGNVSENFFNQAIYNMTSDCALELFQMATDEFVLYFGIVDGAFHCDLTEI